MPAYDDYTWHEIQSQPEAWAATLVALQAEAVRIQAFFEAARTEQIVYIGCGSTYYLALAAAAAMREIAGRNAIGLPASEAWLAPNSSFPTRQRTLLVAISRSGETTETLRAVESFRAADRGPILTLSCYSDHALAHMGDLNIILPAGQEQSIAQTRAFSTLYLATLFLAALIAGRTDLISALELLPEACRQVLDHSCELASRLAEDVQLTRCFFLGSGSRYGLASELSLKMKEMSLSESEPFHFLEYRHGPQSMASQQTLIIGLVSSSAQAHEQAVLADMHALGARTIVVGPDSADVVLADLDELVRGPLYLPFGQLLAYERAIRRGLNPDRPHQLTAVIRLA
ncbi:MAG: SIS domain-containing protein [Roseiflexaceae bacterium]|nr:SIS domain-containing protein [Roseiflexaceae bacterium]